MLVVPDQTGQVLEIAEKPVLVWRKVHRVSLRTKIVHAKLQDDVFFILERRCMPNIKSERESKLRIGGVTISVVSCEDNLAVRINNACQCFVTNREPDVSLQVYYGQIPESKSEKKVFDTGTTWNMFQSNGKYILKDSDRIAIFEPDFKSGRIYIKRNGRKAIFPLSYPLDEVLMINLLAKGRGMAIHACGVSGYSQGLLFVGSSGAGKSTIANFWKKEKDATILSDDRIIIRKMDSEFWIYGTPWHGDAKVCSPERAPLDKVLFLRHSLKNTAKKIAPMEAVSRLMVCSFPAFWDKNGMEFTLKFCAELVKKIPCYELGFVPGAAVLDFVKDL